MVRRTIYPWLLVFLSTILGVIGVRHSACAQQSNDPSSLISQYQQAREAYASQQFQKSSELFRNVASQCTGSELAIQCLYYSIMSDWAVEPSDATASRLSEWVEQAEAFQLKATSTAKTLDHRLLDGWIENSHLVCSKWDRQKLRFEAAENRLRGSLAKLKTSGKQATKAASMWIELGSLLLEQRAKPTEAKECFCNALDCCDHAAAYDPSTPQDERQAQAFWGAALASWQLQKYDESKEYLAKLVDHQLDDNIAIQLRVLKTKLAKATQQTINIAEELQPAIQIALAGSPQATVIYELAMALIDAGEHAKANQIMFELVHRFPSTPLSIEARVRLARHAADQGQWPEAIELAQQAIQLGCNQDLLPHARLILGQSQLESNRPQDAILTLELASKDANIDFEMQVSVRFHLAEALYQMERWTDADVHWKWLLDVANKTSHPSERKPDWLATILLRKAEMLALRKDWGQAEEIVLGIRSDFPECNRRCEVDYLLARCQVSKANFDGARETLAQIAQRLEAKPSELLARANWMAGETFLMQRRYEEARSFYQQVLKVPQQAYWHSAALLQIGQCAEASQDSKSAHEAYTNIVEHFSDSPFAALAKERLALLPAHALAKQTVPDSPGTKR
jgi:TolA-binding protein